MPSATPTPTPGPTPTIRGLPRPLARAMEAYAERLDVAKIREAYDLAVEAHSGQRRASGEEYVSHTVEVATILATLRLDSASIIAGLIHDTVEDTALSVGDVETRFGKEVSTIVDGVTKLGRVQFSSATEILAGARDEAGYRDFHEDWVEPFEALGRVLTPSHTAWTRAALILTRLVQPGARSPGGFTRGFLNDCLLAASAREAGFTLVTADTPDFALIRTVEPRFQFTEPWPG